MEVMAAPAQADGVRQLQEIVDAQNEFRWE